MRKSFQLPLHDDVSEMERVLRQDRREREHAAAVQGRQRELARRLEAAAATKRKAEAELAVIKAARSAAKRRSKKRTVGRGARKAVTDGAASGGASASARATASGHAAQEKRG